MPMNADELNIWCSRLNLTQQAQTIIEIIRNSEPSRRVGGNKKSVSGRYPSRKMGVTIQFESHKVELSFIYQLEQDEDVLEFYDQPSPIKLSYQSESGRDISFYYTPDFFVIRSNSAGWVECKPEGKWQELAEKNPNRYFLGEDNQWHSPPAEQYAEKFGFDFRLWSDAEVDWTLQRNLEFLEDYYRSVTKSCPVPESAINTVISLVSAQPGITLVELLGHAQGVSSDEIYFMIVFGEIFVDLTAAPLVEAERCIVFRDRVTASAYSLVERSQPTADTLTFPVINLVPGTLLSYNGKSLSIKLVGGPEVGDAKILLLTEDGEPVEFKLATFEDLVGLKQKKE
jgi:hypothetical protein